MYGVHIHTCMKWSRWNEPDTRYKHLLNTLQQSYRPNPQTDPRIYGMLVDLEKCFHILNGKHVVSWEFLNNTIFFAHVFLAPLRVFAKKKILIEEV